MQSVSAAFQTAMATGAARLLKIEQLNASLGLTGTVFQTDAFEGTVTAKQSQEVRRDLQLRLQNINGIYTPKLTSDPFFFNQKVRVSIGAVLADGTTEYCVIGVFMVNTSEADEAARSISVGFSDLWKLLQINRLLTRVSYTPGTTLAAIFNDLLDKAGVAAAARSIDAAGTSTTLGGQVPLSFGRGTRISDALATFAEAYGWDFWFDVTGVFTARPFVSVDTQPTVFTYADTDAGVIKMVRRWEDSPNIANHVGVAGIGADMQPVFQEAKDSNQNSPTYYLGIFGDRYDEYRDESITTAAQALAVARDRLRRELVLVDTIVTEGTPRPELDVYDVGTLTIADGKVAARPYWLESFSIPLHIAPAQMRFSAVMSLP